ncbi:MAG: TonB-dependent receptor domain-containing protein, partial [Bacteroidales bacterium]
AYRWETFPAMSLGWVISEEGFMSGLSFMNFLKLRGSYGETGNKDISSSRFITSYSNNLSDRYGDASLISGGTRISNLGTPTLTWETTESLDVGVDFGLLQNRINGSVAYYRQDVTDLLLFSGLPPSAGVGGIWNNIGDMRNYGVEFSINSTNINIPELGFKWTSRFNLTLSNDEVLALTPRYDLEGLGVRSGRTIAKTGLNLWNYYICEWAGVDPERGVDLIYEIDYEHWEQTGETVKTGRVIPATQTNLGRNSIILEGKTSVPKYFGGFDNTFTFKGFDLNIFFTFTGGHYLYDYEEQRTTSVQYGQVVLREDL